MSIRIPIVCLTAALCFAGVACNKNNDSDNSADRGSTTDKAQEPVAADNTAKNKADRDANAKTPFDQSESSADITITAEIRRAIMKAEDMSTNAQNCKIMTEKGAVTLRGPVNNNAEKERISTLANSVAGVVRVDNQLEIKTP